MLLSSTACRAQQKKGRLEETQSATSAALDEEAHSTRFKFPVISLTSKKRLHRYFEAERQGILSFFGSLCVLQRIHSHQYIKFIIEGPQGATLAMGRVGGRAEDLCRLHRPAGAWPSAGAESEVCRAALLCRPGHADHLHWGAPGTGQQGEGGSCSLQISVL